MLYYRGFWRGWMQCQKDYSEISPLHSQFWNLNLVYPPIHCFLAEMGGMSASQDALWGGLTPWDMWGLCWHGPLSLPGVFQKEAEDASIPRPRGLLSWTVNEPQIATNWNTDPFFFLKSQTHVASIYIVQCLPWITHITALTLHFTLLTQIHSPRGF